MSEENPVPRAGDALVIVDAQNDFGSPRGALYVRGGEAIVAVLDGWIARFEAAGLAVVATRDWHPADHCSFVEQGGVWPPHCVAGTWGAAFLDGLALPPSAKIVSKARERDREAYSGFSGTQLADWLRGQGVRRLFVGGLATDYCVRETVLDARREGFEVVLLTAAIRAVDVEPGDGDAAVAAMTAAGARLVGETAPASAG